MSIRRTTNSWRRRRSRRCSDSIVGKVRASLFVLLGAVGFVLLIAAVNLASLLLARATRASASWRFAPHSARDASRLVRQLFTESMVLALAGGALGVLVAQIGARLLAAARRPANCRAPRTVGLDERVVLFTAARHDRDRRGVRTGAGDSRVVARSCSNRCARDRAAQRAATGGLRNALVVTEVALAMILVVGAGLMTRSFVKLLQVDLGFVPEHRVAINYSDLDRAALDRAGDARRRIAQMLDKVRTVPGVSRPARFATAVPRRRRDRRLLPPGVTPGPNGQLPTATLMFTSDGFFNAMGIPLLAGRDLSPQRSSRARRSPSSINQALAKKYFPDQNPVGQTLTFGDTNHFAIVGVVGDVRKAAVDETPAPRIYASVYQIFRVKVNSSCARASDPQLMIKRVEDAIRAVDPQQTITAAFTLDDAVERSGRASAPAHGTARIVRRHGPRARRTRHLRRAGVSRDAAHARDRRAPRTRRAAARRADDMVVGSGLRLAGLGVAIGLAGALVLTRLMQGVLYGVTPNDPLTLRRASYSSCGLAMLAPRGERSARRCHSRRLRAYERGSNCC